MRHRPDVQRDHQRRRPSRRRASPRRSSPPHCAKPRTRGRRPREAGRCWRWRRRPRTSPRNRPAGRAQTPDRPCRPGRAPPSALGRPPSQALLERRLELCEAAQRDARHQFIAVAKMPVGRGGADAGMARGLGEGETGRAVLGDKVQRGADQRLAQVSVMVAAGLVLAPAHVKGFYMSPAASSMQQDPRREDMACDARRGLRSVP